jgi:hypothetical protein
MPDKRPSSLPPRRVESRLVKAATDAVKNTCANPDRLDCPDIEAIQSVVVRTLSHPTFDDTVDHIAMCAPCFEEYNRRRQQLRVRCRRRWVVGFAALLLLGFLLIYHPAKQQAPVGPIAQKAPAPFEVATLDFSGWTAERSLPSSPIKRDAPRVSRARLALTLLLPIGTEDGAYTVQVRAASGEIVAQANGVANWTGQAEKLDISLDLRNVPAGAYTLAIQSADASQRIYPVVLE